MEPIAFAGFAEHAKATVRVLAQHPMKQGWTEIARTRAAGEPQPGLGLYAWSHPGVRIPERLWKLVDPFELEQGKFAIRRATLRVQEVGSSLGAQLTFTEKGMDCMAQRLSKGGDPLQAAFACATGDRIELVRTANAEVVVLWQPGKSPREELAFELEGPGTLSVTLPIIADPGHAPRPATASCRPTVYMWFDLTRHENVYFDDEPFTVHYSVDCATSITVTNLQHTSAQTLLNAAIRGEFLDDGGSGAFYADAASAGVLRGSLDIPAGAAPGRYFWRISAANNLNPARPSAVETATWTILGSPRMDASCDTHRPCLREMVRHIVPGVPDGITHNPSLDSEVQAFAGGVYDRSVIGLQLERELETMDTNAVIHCTTCAGGTGGHYDERHPERITLDFCERTFPTDYAVLHELTHKIGFDTRLVRAMIDAGVWPSNWPWEEYRNRVEQMTAEVSGAAFDASRICSDY
jgi:hypothetical protein